MRMNVLLTCASVLKEITAVSIENSFMEMPAEFSLAFSIEILLNISNGFNTWIYVYGKFLMSHSPATPFYARFYLF